MAKRKAKTKLTTIMGVVIDRSGSMEGVRDDTIGGYNAWLKEQRAEKTDDAKVFVTLFGGADVVRWAEGEAPDDVKELDRGSYVPEGFTPLYDAMGRTMAEMEKAMGDRYLLVVLTDGYENSSVEWTHVAVTERIKGLEATGNWTVVYLGSTPNAVEIGKGMGIAAGNTAHYAQGATGQTVQGLSRATISYRRHMQTNSVTMATETKKHTPDG